MDKTVQKGRLEVLGALTAARKKFATSPWTKGTFQRVTKSGKTAYCAIGAVYAVTGGYGELARATVRELNEATGHRNRNYRGDVAGYNDSRATRKADVLAVFNGAIRRLQRRVKQAAA